MLQKEGYVCEKGHVKGNGYDDEATVCHCYDSLCNVEVPELTTLPDPTTTPGSKASTGEKINFALLFTLVSITFICF